jgi:hypothetical protein
MPVVTPRTLALVLLPLACTRGEVASRPGAPSASPSPSPSLSALSIPPLARAPAPHALARPADAVAELGVLTDRTKEELARLTTPAALGGLLEARFCGPATACEAVRAFLETGQVHLSVVPADEWGLPPEATLVHVAKGLSPQERASVHKKTRIVVVRASARPSVEQLAARAAFALTAAIAVRLRAFVYDETVRRIETAEQFAAHAITEKLGDPTFRGDRIVIQLYQQDDATARLISLGMRRFGAPDLEIRGAQMGAGKSLGNVMNAVALRLASGLTEVPLTVTLDDVSRATGHAPAELHTGTAPPIPQEIDLVVPPPQQGDPDNTVVRLVPAGGDTARGYDDLAIALFGSAERLLDVPSDPALDLARERAAHAFPGAVARWKAMRPRATLLVKLPFAVPGDAGPSAGGVESMWVEVKSIEGATIAGVLANSPALIPDLGQGSPVRGQRKELEDWILKLPDAGTEGGETIKILENR